MSELLSEPEALLWEGDAKWHPDQSQGKNLLSNSVRLSQYVSSGCVNTHKF